MTEAFAVTPQLPGEFLATIAAGDEGGKLQRSFTEIAQTTAVAVTTLLAAFQEIFLRLVMLSAIGAVVLTLWSLFASH